MDERSDGLPHQSFESKEPNEQLEGLTKVVQKHLPDWKRAFQGHYCFFFPKVRLDEDKEDEDKKKDEVIGGIVERYLNFQIYDPAGVEQRKSFIDQDIDAISEEYKIHLQPKREHLPQIIERLSKVIADDQEIRDAISSFKILKSEYKDEEGNNMPEIVIYPKYGRENFEQVLNKLFKAFEDLESMGSGVVPRYNHKLSELLFVAQSGGDLKNLLKKDGLFDEYFDPKYNYAFRRGEEPPQIKKGIQEEEPEDLKTELRDKSDLFPWTGEPILINAGEKYFWIVDGSRYGANSPYLLVDQDFDYQRFVQDGPNAQGFKGIWPGKTIEIGRSNPMRFKLPDTVSQRHFSITFQPKGDQQPLDQFIITDLNSTNGTVVNKIKGNQ